MSEQEHSTGQAVQTLESRSVRGCWTWCVLIWVEVHLAEWLQEESLQTLCYKMYMELILESGAHSPEDEDISAQRDGGTDSDTADANFPQWTDSTHCPTLPVVHKFIGGPSGLQQKQRHPMSLKTFLLSVFKLFCFEIIQLLGEVTNRYYRQSWTHWTKVGPHSLM
jgi:hypothetical protein